MEGYERGRDLLRNMAQGSEVRPEDWHVEGEGGNRLTPLELADNRALEIIRL